jgi:hypothetical protein
MPGAFRQAYRWYMRSIILRRSYENFHKMYGNQYHYLGFDNVICPTIMDTPVAKRCRVRDDYRFFDEPGLLKIYHGIWQIPK